MTARSEIAAQAEAWIGTAYHPQGRSRAGVSCIGLVIAVGQDLGIVPHGFDPGPYPEKPDGTLVRRLAAHLLPVAPALARPGAVMVIAGAVLPSHVGILTRETPRGAQFVHASRAHGRVVVGLLDHNWRQRAQRVVAAFDFPGVRDG